MTENNEKLREFEDRVRLADARVREAEKAEKAQQDAITAEQQAEADRVAKIASLKAEYASKAQAFDLSGADAIRREIQSLEAGTQSTQDDSEKAKLIDEYLDLQRQINEYQPSHGAVVGLRDRQMRVLRKIQEPTTIKMRVSIIGGD